MTAERLAKNWSVSVEDFAMQTLNCDSTRSQNCPKPKPIKEISDK
jgi:hypothetical protein